MNRCAEDSMAGHNAVVATLEIELDRLRMTTGLGMDLRVVWQPSPDKDLAGEVKGNTIYIYEDEGKAIGILRHEFLDFCISQAIEPYKRMANSLIKIVNTDAYARKEEVVESLSRLILTKAATNDKGKNCGGAE